LASNRTDNRRPVREVDGFAKWFSRFRNIAIDHGIGEKTLEDVFHFVEFDPEVIRKNNSQPEHLLQIGEYVARTTTRARVSAGTLELKRLEDFLDRMEERFRVDRGAIISIWGLESAYGAFMGKFRVVNSLTSLALDGQRREFAERELVSSLAIIEAGTGSKEGMLGSWAGAMGHTQFIPSSYLRYGCDFDRDGRIDIWDPDNPIDSLASTANFLACAGWKFGCPSSAEVRLPGEFDYFSADGLVQKSPSKWFRLGVSPINSESFQDCGDFAILLPSGANGAFALFENFRVIKTYNNSNAYALAVGQLRDGISGKDIGCLPWPKDTGRLFRNQIKLLQQRLNELGYEAGTADGIPGPDTASAVRRYQSDKGQIPDGHISRNLVNEVLPPDQTRPRSDIQSA